MLDNNLDLFCERLEIETKEQWSLFIKDDCLFSIPYLQFDSTWLIRIIPPYGGAIVRYLVKHNNKELSVYLDCFNRLGTFYSNGKTVPYWEILDFSTNETYRFEIKDTNGLIDCIRQCLH